MPLEFQVAGPSGPPAPSDASGAVATSSNTSKAIGIDGAVSNVAVGAQSRHPSAIQNPASGGVSSGSFSTLSEREGDVESAVAAAEGEDAANVMSDNSTAAQSPEDSDIPTDRVSSSSSSNSSSEEVEGAEEAQDAGPKTAQVRASIDTEGFAFSLYSRNEEVNDTLEAQEANGLNAEEVEELAGIEEAVQMSDIDAAEADADGSQVSEDPAAGLHDTEPVVDTLAAREGERDAESVAIDAAETQGAHREESGLLFLKRVWVESNVPAHCT
jgi:hypothetical protein